MAVSEETPEFLNPDKKVPKDPRSVLPWIIAGIVVLIVLGIFLLRGHQGPPPNPGGAGLASPDPYAASLAISNIQMSEASSVAGGKTTYVDGLIANHGSKTVNGITVQVAFRDFTNQLVQKETMPLNLIRTHEPYIDTEPVSAAPIGPGETREFRLIFDHLAEGWNQNYPEIRVIEVKFR
ncbi:MAG TPA: DUF2393 family protein [Silvibacterium sp.]|jgi:hypothetical protein|nr:DUF2393 family protein [Silvibacterium sp.]